MKWRNSKERELLSTGGSRDQTLPTRSNPNPDLSDVGDTIKRLNANQNNSLITANYTNNNYNDQQVIKEEDIKANSKLTSSPDMETHSPITVKFECNAGENEEDEDYDEEMQEEVEDEVFGIDNDNDNNDDNDDNDDDDDENNSYTNDARCNQTKHKTKESRQVDDKRKVNIKLEHKTTI